MKPTNRFLRLLLTLVTLACAACGGAAPKATPDTAPPTRSTLALDPPPAASATPTPAPRPNSTPDPAQAFLAELELAERARRESSLESMRQAERLTHELRYQDAAQLLRDALSRDSKNEELLRRLQQLHFLLDDRSGEIREFTRELQDRAQVRDQQLIAELHLLYEEGVRLLDESKFAEATKVLDRLVSRIDQLDASQPLVFGERARALRERARTGSDQ